jgi:hypothetical protein
MCKQQDDSLENQYSLVSREHSYGLDGQGTICGRGQDVTIHYDDQMNSGAHTAFCLMRTGDSYPRGKTATT